jgi:hypothetical protein
MNNPSELVKDANSSTVSSDGLYTGILGTFHELISEHIAV